MSENSEEYLEVPLSELSRDAVEGLVDAFLTRQGHNPELSLEKERQTVLSQLNENVLKIVWDPFEQSSNIMSADDFQRVKKRNNLT